MKSSILLGVLVCGGLVVGACSSGSAQFPQAAPTYTGPEHSDVTLENAGAEPRRVLRFAPVAGTRGVWAVERSQSQVASSGVQTMKIIDAQVRSKAEWEVERSDAVATVVKWRWMEPPSVVRIDGDRNTVTDYRAAVERNADMTWRSRTRNVMGDEALSNSAKSGNADGTSSEITSGALEPFLPAEAVGAGASWTFVRTSERGVERLTVRVASMTATETVVEYSGTSRAPAQGGSSGAETTWSGRAKWIEGLPDWAELTLDARTSAQVQRVPDSPQMVDMRGRAKMARSCRVK
ncbi:MAG: hypothetical protein QM783_05650 [Phycisphaerales bacterium]